MAPGRSQTRCVSPRQYSSGANVTACTSVPTGIVSAAATASARWSRATPCRSKTSARRSSAAAVVGPAEPDRGGVGPPPARTRGRGARRDRGRSAAALETRAARGFPRAAPCSGVRVRTREAASTAPRRAPDPTSPCQHCSAASVDDSGARNSRHQNAPRSCRAARLEPRADDAGHPAAPSTSTARRGSHVGSAAGANAASATRRYAPTSPAAPVKAEHLQDEVDRIDDQAERKRRERQGDDGQRDARGPDDEPQHRPPRIQGGDRRRRQKPFSSHSRCAPSIAANSAPTTPMPRPATTSILTPASCSARSTPAW